MTTAINGSPHASPILDGGSRPRAPSPLASFARSTPKQYVVTSVPLTVTPASAISNSSRTSPTSTLSQMDTSTSQQTSPEGLQPVLPHSSQFPAFNSSQESMSQLKDSKDVVPQATSPPSAMVDAVALSTKGPGGLVRRLSRGAHRLTRRRGSTSASNRDHSCGPVIMRRRSDSKNMTSDTSMDVSDLELEHPDEEQLDEPRNVFALNGSSNALGITTGRPGISSTASHQEGGVAPLRPTLLEQGTFLTKVTKRKRKNIKFRLDFESAKVVWDPSSSSKQFYIDDVREIRSGREARNYREEFGIPADKESRWFTIIYADPDRSKGRSIKTVHLIAPDSLIFQQWTETLETVSRSRIEMMAGLVVGNAERSAKILWRQTMDKQFKGAEHPAEAEQIDFTEVTRICRNLHFHCTEAAIRTQFDKADDDRTGRLSQAQFLDFIRRLKERRDIREIFESMRPAGQDGLDLPRFLQFLMETQSIDIQENIDHWINVFNKYAGASRPPTASSDPLHHPGPNMRFAAFQAFLSSPANSVLASTNVVPHLDHPLNEYFISSSHNTYLLGRQVGGISSTEAYIFALQKGCRCVEIDCWDGSDGNPIVVHGRTFTTSVPFLDCVTVIAKYAFVSSPYPLIISLEVHCNAQQQEVMVRMMRDQFGDMLLDAPLYPDGDTLPSPEELRGRILIKVKGPQESESRPSKEEMFLAHRSRSHSSPYNRPVGGDMGAIPSPPMLSSPAFTPAQRPQPPWTPSRLPTTPASIGLPSQASSTDDSDSPVTTPSTQKKKKRSKIVQSLGELGIYTRGVKPASFDSPEAKSFDHVWSLAERTFEGLCDRNTGKKEVLEEHNMRSLMRVYPSGHRIASTNFEPTKFWRRGVQMAATNWQTYDQGQQINDAMFAAGTDRTGYVLKPEELREPRYITGADGTKKKSKKLMRFSVHLISAQQLPRPKNLRGDATINPYVEFEMHSAEDKSRGIATGEGGADASARGGMSGIGAPLRKRTKIVDGNGYDPQYSETLTLTLETRYPSLVFVRFTIWNSPDGRNLQANGLPLAVFTAKLSSLQQGYRHLPLYDNNGEQYLFSSLFCKITKGVPVEFQHDGTATSVAMENLSVQPALPDNKSSKSEFFRRLISRRPSQMKKKDSGTKERDLSDGSSFFSRTSTTEKER